MGMPEHTSLRYLPSINLVRRKHDILKYAHDRKTWIKIRREKEMDLHYSTLLYITLHYSTLLYITLLLYIFSYLEVSNMLTDERTKFERVLLQQR